MPKFTFQRPLPVKRTQWTGSGKQPIPVRAKPAPLAPQTGHGLKLDLPGAPRKPS